MSTSFSPLLQRGMSLAVEVITMPERKARMEATFQPLGLSYTVFPAVIGRELNIAADPRVAGSKLTAGEVGCLLSHVGAMEKYRGSSLSYVAIFEDDAVPTAAYKVGSIEDALLRLEASVGSAWDLLYLGRCYDACGKTEFPFATEDLVRVSSPICLHAYVVRVGSIPAVIDTILPARDSVDFSLTLAIRVGRLKAYATNPPLFAQRGADTMIEGRDPRVDRLKLPMCREWWWGHVPSRLSPQYVNRQNRFTWLVAATGLVLLGLVLWWLIGWIRSR